MHAYIQGHMHTNIYIMPVWVCVYVIRGRQMRRWSCCPDRKLDWANRYIRAKET
jgi:hypothetical protein